MPDVAVESRRTLLADDDYGFISAAQNVVTKRAIPNVVCTHQYSEAVEIIDANNLARLVADLRFDGESDDGVGLLQRARDRHGSLDCVLLTGFEPNDDQKRRLRGMRARVFSKRQLTAQVLSDLLGGSRLEDVSGTMAEPMDIGALRLQYEDLDELNGLLIQDILESIDAIKPRNDKRVIIGQRALSVAELRDEIETRSDVGVKVIRMHHALMKRLRGQK